MWLPLIASSLSLLPCVLKVKLLDMSVFFNIVFHGIYNISDTLRLGMFKTQRVIAHYEKCSVEHMSNSTLDSGPLDDFAMVYWGDSRGVKI